MRVYEIRIDGGDDALKERVARTLCPDENHPPPCPVPWSFGYEAGAVVLVVYAMPQVAGEVVERVRMITSRAVTITEGDVAEHEELVVQYRVESRGRR